MSESIKELITLAQAGDEKSREELWEAFAPLRYSWAKRIVLSGWEWEDLQQEAYILLIEAIRQYDSTRGMSFEGYYKVSLYNWGYKKYRKRQEYLGIVSDITEQDAYQVPTYTEDIADNIYLQACCVRAVELLRGLDDLDRELLTRHYFANQTLKAVGESLGLKDKAAYTRVSRILKKLRSRF
ncbi:MAG: sigma-70 family RNA polymerase sigma factor [Cellulosilyticaceae bacterium]